MTGQSPDELQLTNEVDAPQNGDELQKLVVFEDDCDECEVRITGLVGLLEPGVFGDALLTMSFGSNLITFFYDSNEQILATNPNGSGSSPLPTTWIPASNIGLIEVSVTNIPSIYIPSLFYGTLENGLNIEFEIRCPETRNGKQQVLSYLTSIESWSLSDNFTRTGATSTMSMADELLTLPCPEGVQPTPRFLQP